MEKELRKEIGKLEQAVKVLVESKTDLATATFFKILVELRVRYGFNVFGKMAFAFAYSLINEDTHHLICFAEKGTHILYSKDVLADDKVIRTPTFKHLCYIINNKYGGGLHHFRIEAVTRICLDFLSYYEITQALDKFQSFDESDIERILERKGKLNKINSL